MEEKQISVCLHVSLNSEVCGLKKIVALVAFSLEEKKHHLEIVFLLFFLE